MRLFLTLVFLFSVSALCAQRPENSVYMAGGYNIQSPSVAPLDYVIDRYNETRNFLTDKMDKVSIMSGPAFTFGFNMGEENSFFILELGLTLGSSGALSSQGTVNGVSQKRDLKLTSYFVSFGVGYITSSDGSFEYGGALYFEIGGFKVKTTGAYDANQTAPDFEDIGSSETLVSFTPTLYLDYNFSEKFGLSLRPFYRFQILSNDLSNVSANINPATYQNDDPEKIKGNMLSGFGGELKAIFYF